MYVVVELDIGRPELALPEIGDCCIDRIVDEPLIEFFGNRAGAVSQTGRIHNYQWSCVKNSVGFLRFFGRKQTEEDALSDGAIRFSKDQPRGDELHAFVRALLYHRQRLFPIGFTFKSEFD